MLHSIYIVNTELKLLALAGCFLLTYSCKERPTSMQEPSTKTKSLASKTSISAKKSSSTVFDIPSLLHLSISQAKAKLGRPMDEEQADYENATRVLIYKKQGLVLTVSYLVGTQQVDMVSLAIDRDTTAFQYLLPLGNLSATNNSYSIDTLHSEKVGLYRGIVVRANPPIEYPTAP